MDQEKRDKVVRLFREMTAGGEKAVPAAAPVGRRKHRNKQAHEDLSVLAGTHIINSTIVVCGDGCQEVVAKLLGSKRRPR